MFAVFWYLRYFVVFVAICFFVPCLFCGVSKKKKIEKGQKPELMCLSRKRTPVAKFLQFVWHLPYSVVFVADCFSVPCLFYGVCKKKKKK